MKYGRLLIVALLLAVVMWWATGQIEAQEKIAPHLSTWDRQLYADYDCDCWRLDGPEGEIVFIHWATRGKNLDGYLLPQEVVLDNDTVLTAGAQVYHGNVYTYPEWSAVAVTHGYDGHCIAVWVTTDKLMHIRGAYNPPY